MSIPYDAFTGAFLYKISEFELLELDDNTRTEVIDGYRKRAVLISLNPARSRTSLINRLVNGLEKLPMRSKES